MSIAKFDSWPHFDDEMVGIVSQVLRSGKVNYWTGSEGQQFEEEYAAHCNCRHAIAVANGTLALELALYSLDIGPGDEVIVPCRTFIASASSVVARGAIPVMADVDAESQTLTRQSVERALSPRTKGIIAVHLAGWPCEMDDIMELATSHGIAVVEDCAQAHGAKYKGRPVGSIGDVGTFSYCQDKILTTGGEGGMLVTNRPDLWDRAWRYKDHGKDPDAFYQPSPPSNTFRWLHDSFGSNYRLSEMQSAIGRVMLRRLPAWHEARKHHASLLFDRCTRCPALRTPLPPPHIEHANYKFYTFVRPDRLKADWNRDRIIQAIRDRGVQCYSGSCSEIYREQAFPSAWKPAEPLPVARELGETSLMFLVHPTLTQQNLMDTNDAIDEVLGEATKLSHQVPAQKVA